MEDIENISNEQECTDTMEMPKYKCIKTVHALKISKIVFDINEAEKEGRETDCSAIIYPQEDNYAPFKVSSSFVDKHEPKEGGYYVVYEDGYASYSPAHAFEKGYVLIK